MAKIISSEVGIHQRHLRPVAVSPLPPRFVLEYMSLCEELRQVKQRLTELENREKVIMLREITREEAKQEIRQLFSSGRTLYYSDIVKELGIDLETVVNICNELESEREIGVDAGISQ